MRGPPPTPASFAVWEKSAFRGFWVKILEYLRNHWMDLDAPRGNRSAVVENPTSRCGRRAPAHWVGVLSKKVGPK